MTIDKRVIEEATLENLRRTILSMFADNPFNDVGIRQICQEARVSPQTIYKYFGSKEMMLFACIRDDMEKLNKAASTAAAKVSKPLEQIEALLQTWCRFYGKNPVVARIVFLNIPVTYWISERDSVQMQLWGQLRSAIENGQKAKKINRELPPDVLLDMLIGGLHRIMARWLTEGKGSFTKASQQAMGASMHLLTS